MGGEVDKIGGAPAPKMTWEKLKADAKNDKGTKAGFAETMAQINEMRDSDRGNYKQERLEEMNGNKNKFTRDSVRTDFV